MKLTENFLKVDLTLQILLMGIMFAGVLVSIAKAEGEFMGVFIMGEFFLGLWQVFSALILGIAYRDKARGIYLAMVGLYFVSFSSLTIFMDKFHNIFSDVFPVFFGGILLLIIPLFFAFWYVFRTYFDLQKIRNYPRSFWDLT